MRKAWRWLLGSLAALALLLALFVWDALRRAEAAIDAHERRIALDIAALRAAHARLPSMSEGLPTTFIFESPYGDLSASSVKQIQELISSGVFNEYEKAKPWDSLDTLCGLSPISRLRREPPLPSAKEIIENLALPQDWLRGGGVSKANERHRSELHVIRYWKALLESQGLSATELERSVSAMDRLHRVRPSVRESLEGERVMDKIRVIRVLRSRSDDQGTLSREPGWRSMFLWRVFIAQTLTSIDRMYRDYGQVDSLVFHERPAAAMRMHEEITKTGRLPPLSTWGTPIPSLYSEEAKTLRDWSLMRLATAIAWFEAEQGRFPVKLEELAPRYIERIPLCPATGLPSCYSNGELSTGYEPGKGITWRVGRKK